MADPSEDVGRRNNYDLLRLVAASAVLFGHSFVLIAPEQGARSLDPLSHWMIGVTGFGETLHDFAVNVFFAISGYLIARSLLRRPDVVHFVVSRLLRLYPAAILAAFATALAGLAFTTLPAGAYLADPQTWSFVMKNSLVFSVDYHLPGVFGANPHGAAVNGSLWTLPHELRLYLYTLGLGVLTILRRRWAMNALFAVLCVDFVLGLGWPLGLSDLLWRLWLHFFGGAVLAVNGWRPRLWPAMALAAACVALAGTGAAYTLAFSLATVYWVHLAAQGRYWRAADPGRAGDISYGVYLYAFPIQQGLIALAPGAWTGWRLASAALVVTYALAILSWVLVERRALDLKDPATRAIKHLVPASLRR
jgi:peptidoglycan/LPS O-acetylase OafA/YrhL